MQIIEHMQPPTSPLLFGRRGERIAGDPLSHPTRDDRRVDLEGRVTLFSEREDPVTERTQNVSATGMFIRTRSLRPAGTHLRFSLDLANGLEPIQGRAEVMWVRRHDAGLFRPAGMGVRFVDLDQESRQLMLWSVAHRTRELRKFLHLDAVEVPAGGRSDLKELRTELEVALGEAVEPSVLAELRSEVDVALQGVLEDPSAATAEPTTPASERHGRHPDAGRPDAGPHTGSASAPQTAIRFGRRAWKAVSAVPLVPLAIWCIYLLSPAPEPAEATPPTPAARAESLPAASLVRQPIGTQQDGAVLGEISLQPVGVEGELEQLTRAWAEAWSQQRARAYLAFYSPAFQPPEALSRAAWETQREERILKPRDIQIEVSDLETEILSADRARVRFGQSYRSERFHDQVRKTLDLVRGEQGWQILAERTET